MSLKICEICKKEILSKGEYCNMIQYDKRGKFFKSIFFHTVCFIERWRGNLQVGTKIQEMISRTNDLIDKMGIRI